MNWAEIIKTVRQSGVKYFVVEQDNNWEVDSFTSAKTSAKYLRGIR